VRRGKTHALLSGQPYKKRKLENPEYNSDKEMLQGEIARL